MSVYNLLEVNSCEEVETLNQIAAIIRQKWGTVPEELDKQLYNIHSHLFNAHNYRYSSETIDGVNMTAKNLHLSLIEIAKSLKEMETLAHKLLPQNINLGKHEETQVIKIKLIFLFYNIYPHFKEMIEEYIFSLEH